MHVKIDQEQKQKGLVFKKTAYVVAVTVTFSEQELAGIKKQGLAKRYLAERPPPENLKNLVKDEDRQDYFLLIQHLMSGRTDRYEFETAIEAKQYEDTVLNGLRALKANLEADAGPSSKSVEI